MERAYFFPRVLAYLIDIIIVSLIAGMITVFLPTSSNYEELVKESSALQEKYIQQEISADEYLGQVALITYDLDYASVLSYIVQIVIVILYYVVFQFYQKGQTIGKKLMKIRVVGQGDRELTINDYIYRSMLLNSVFLSMLTTALVLFLKRDTYFYVILSLQMVQFVLLLITILMCILRKDGRGLHDMIAHTKVVMDKEEVK